MNHYQLVINKPLLILGLPGSGKTYLAETLLKDSREILTVLPI